MRYNVRLLVGILIVLGTLAALPGCRRTSDALDRVLESGLLRVGMDASFPPFEYVGEEGNLVGFDVDLAREVARRLGVEVRFTASLPYDGLYDALTAGQVDVVISALYADPTRMGAFAYSTSYFNAGQVLVVREEVDIARVEGWTGQLAVEFGSEGDVVARSWQQRSPDLMIVPCLSADEALSKVEAGEADAALVDHLSVLMRAGEGLRIVAEAITDEPYAIAVRREDRGLLRAINEALMEMEADGAMDRLRRLWFSPNR